MKEVPVLLFSTMANMDYVGLKSCLVETEKTCDSGFPTDFPQMTAVTLPALRTPTMAQSTGFAKKLCTAGKGYNNAQG